MTRKLKALIIYALFLALGGVAGGFIGRAANRLGAEKSIPLYFTVPMLFLIVLLAFVLHIAVHECGHGIFGALSGYKFISYRIFSIMLKKESGRLKIRRFALTGTAGQCLMAPPGNYGEDFPVVLYNMGGVIANLITAAAFMAAALLFPGNFLFLVFSAAMAFSGVLFALTNGIPWRLQYVDNDGRNALELFRNFAARKFFWLQLKINAMMSDGLRLRDLPREWFFMPSREEMNNSFAASSAYIFCSRLMDEREFSKARDIMALMGEIADAMPPIYRKLLEFDYLYCMLMLGEDGAQKRRRAMNPKEIKAMGSLMPVMRTEYAYMLLADGDEAGAAELLKRFGKAAAKYPYAGEAEGEKDLMIMARARFDENARGKTGGAEEV